MNPMTRTADKNTVRRLLLCAAFGALIAAGFANPANATADPGTACVNPDGTPCTPTPQGCVLPENSLPCSSSLPDINAAIRQELQQVLGGLAR